MRVYLINPSDVAFGLGVTTPRWLKRVLAGATPAKYGDPIIADDTLERFDLSSIQPADVVGTGIHSANVFRGFDLDRELRQRGAWVIYGGIKMWASVKRNTSSVRAKMLAAAGAMVFFERAEHVPSTAQLGI